VRSFVPSVWAVGAAVAGLAGGLSGQVSLTLTQTPNVFPSPVLADFNAGVIAEPTGILFTLNVTGGAANVARTSTVSIRASSATLGGGKVLSDLEWRRADLATWNPMTTTDAAIESRTVKKNGTNDPWSNTVFLRMHLTWSTDAPGTYSTDLVFTLTITTP
jgi:hypothetical protein